MTDLLLDWMSVHGVSILVVALLAQPLGLPIPTSLLVLSTGAFARQGLLDWRSVAAISLTTSIAGDCAGYGLGRAGGRWVQCHVGSRYRSLWLGTEDQLRHKGGQAIYLTRVVLTPLQQITNLAAGSAGYPFPHFVAAAAAGRATWIGLYGGLGFFLGSQWTVARQVMETSGPWLVATGSGCVALFLIGHTLSRLRGDHQMAAGQLAGREPAPAKSHNEPPRPQGRLGPRITSA